MSRCGAKTTVGPPPVPLRTPLTLDIVSVRISVRPSFSISARMYFARACSFVEGAGIDQSDPLFNDGVGPLNLQI